MNIEEARKVLWLKSNPRPLGKLLDEGYLTKDRLEWAAQWAYNLKLKEAAQVLLETMNASPSQPEKASKPEPVSEVEKAIPINMTLEKAGTILWPFAPYKGQPMGILVDSKQLSLKDLGYAIENAWDEKVKQAAIAFSLVRLEQVVKEPPPSAGFVHVLSGGRSYSERRGTLFTLLQGMVFGASIAFLIFLTGWAIYDFVRPHPNARPITELGSSLIQIIAVVIALGLAGLLGLLFSTIIDRLTKRLEKQIEEHRLGQEGEDNVVQLMVQALDGNWRIFRNVNLPGHNKGDLDLILVGSPGVWVLEVKNFRGTYRNIGENWQLLWNKKWKPATKSPSKQALNNAVRLANFLKADGLNIFINPVVVWANVASPLSVENPSTPVWHYKRLPDELGNIWQGEKISKEEKEKIIAKLTKVCEDNRKRV